MAFTALVVRLRVAFVLLTELGCSRQVESRGLLATEPSFAQQAAAVHAGATIEIRLETTLVQDDDLQYLADLSENLLRVNLSHSELTDAGVATLCAMHRLEQLRLESPRVSDAGLRSIGGLEHLRFLHLIDMPVTDAGLEQLHGLATLESLYLDGTRVTDTGLARLQGVMPWVHVHVDDRHAPLDSRRFDRAR